ncbi:hypothetical protein GTO89_15570 [Heliobacterium gestii]|uniref:Outer membrane lipoprotein-sorting protein n=1 Tax=Heliomicrobium gestii TaxID=2699 RepID=A0A845LFW9_HELGE|nr:DUF6612 family protein [Heliomicrobium gestii]MBM7868257.1 hypothetical protein [Heliomicrobium gestii]MZP44451.1 hypothetical protein [Heliomicrobium gestii]
MKRWLLNGILGLSLLIAPGAAMADDMGEAAEEAPAISAEAPASNPAMDVFRKATEVSARLTSYLMSGDLQATINIPEAPAPLTANLKLQGAVATEPSRFAMNMTMEMPKLAGQPAVPNAPGSLDFRFYFDGKQMYMQFPSPKNPASNQWVKQELNLPAGYENLLTQSQNPAKALEMMDKMGLMPTNMEETWIDGQRYYVVTVQIDNARFKSYMQEMMALSQPKEGVSPAEMNEALKKIDMDFRYTYYINADTYVTDKTELNGSERIAAEGKTLSIDITGTVRTHDVNMPVKFPDVSNAIDMKELEKQAEKTAKGIKTSK